MDKLLSNAAPFLWNKLQSFIRNCDALLDFKKHLKIHHYRIGFTKSFNMFKLKLFTLFLLYSMINSLVFKNK